MITIESFKRIHIHVMYLKYGHTLWIHDLVAQCTFKIAQALRPRLPHPEAPATLPTIIKHCPGRTKSSEDHNTWFGSWRIGPENFDLHKSCLHMLQVGKRDCFPQAALRPRNFKQWFRMPESPFPGGHGFRPRVVKRTWMHFAYEI